MDHVNMTPDVELKNGSFESPILVQIVMSSLRRLMQRGDACLIYLLREYCLNSDRKLPNPIRDELKNYGLVQQDGEVSKSVRNIILSAVEGGKSNLRLVSPTVH